MAATLAGTFIISCGDHMHASAPTDTTPLDTGTPEPGPQADARSERAPALDSGGRTRIVVRTTAVNPCHADSVNVTLSDRGCGAK